MLRKIKKLTQEIGVLSVGFTLALTITIGLSISHAWTEPTVAPPGGNLGAPINTSSTSQTKNGSLAVYGISYGVYGQDITVGDGSYGFLGFGNYGVRGYGQTAGGYFTNLAGASHAYLARGDFGVYTDYKSYFGGNVGIGTVSPAQKLDVTGNIRATGEIIGTFGIGSGQFRAIAGNYGTMLRNDGSNTYFLSTNSGDQYGSWSSLRPFVFSNSTGNVNLANTIFAQHSGNVGIGTATPAAKLDVNGHFLGGFGAMTSGGVQDWNDSTNSRSGNGYSLLNGTDSNGPAAAGGNYFHPLNFEYASKTGAGNTTQLAIPYSNNPSIDQGLYMRGRYSGTWGNWAKIISENTAGNVGIGTNAPTQRLDVVGSIRATDICTTAGKCLSASNGGDNLGNHVATQAIILNKNKIYFDGNASDENYSIQSPTWNDGMKYKHWTSHQFFTSGAERLRITSGGNVGIGTAAPSQKLDVAGTIKSTGLQIPTSAAAGKVLTSDASGNATWQAASSGADGDLVWMGHVGVHMKDSALATCIGTTISTASALCKQSFTAEARYLNGVFQTRIIDNFHPNLSTSWVTGNTTDLFGGAYATPEGVSFGKITYCSGIPGIWYNSNCSGRWN